MDCPKCGKKIAEGHMYCEECGHEINLVPEFEAEIEESMAESIRAIVNQAELHDTATAEPVDDKYQKELIPEKNDLL